MLFISPFVLFQCRTMIHTNPNGCPSKILFYCEESLVHRLIGIGGAWADTWLYTLQVRSKLKKCRCAYAAFKHGQQWQSKCSSMKLSLSMWIWKAHIAYTAALAALLTVIFGQKMGMESKTPWLCTNTILICSYCQATLCYSILVSTRFYSETVAEFRSP